VVVVCVGGDVALSILFSIDLTIIIISADMGRPATLINLKLKKRSFYAE